MSIVPRPRGFGTREDLVKHIKTIGLRIANDADMISLDPEGVSRMRIVAEIAPGTELTHIEYHIDALADPRVPPYRDK
jgi:hypothetical protein